MGGTEFAGSASIYIYIYIYIYILKIISISYGQLQEEVIGLVQCYGGGYHSQLGGKKLNVNKWLPKYRLLGHNLVFYEVLCCYA